MIQFTIKDILPFFNLLLPVAVGLIISQGKRITVLKFYLRKVCESAGVDCGKDLD